MTHRPNFNVFAPIKREYDDGGGYKTETEEEEEPLALAPSRIAAIIDDLDIEGLPTAVELAAIATSPPSDDEAPAHKKLLARAAGSQLNKPGRAKRALKTEVHELQQMVDRMQAQVTGAASEIQELTRLVGQLVAKKQREEAEATIKQEQLEDEEMERCLAMGDAIPPPPGVVMLEQQLMMGQQERYEDQETKRRANIVEASEMDFPNVAAFLMCAVKQGAGSGRRS